MTPREVLLIFLLGGLLVNTTSSSIEKREAPICGTCKHIANPRECRSFKLCHKSQACQTVREGLRYNLNCVDKSTCRDILHHKSNKRRLLFTLYENMDCCYDSMCNADLFNEDFTTTEKLTTPTTITTTTTTTSIPCEDTRGMNCPELLTKGNICTSVNVGQKYCPKSCHVC